MGHHELRVHILEQLLLVGRHQVVLDLQEDVRGGLHYLILEFKELSAALV